MPILLPEGDFDRRFGGGPPAIIGKDADGFSAYTIVRLKESWSEEHAAGATRSLEKRYVYFWVDGIYANVRLEDERPCFLVIVGATANGMKELVAVQDGVQGERAVLARASPRPEEPRTWLGPDLVIGDGALGFWTAVRKCSRRLACSDAGYTRQQTCSTTSRRTSPPWPCDRALQEIWMAKTKKMPLYSFREIQGGLGAPNTPRLSSAS